MVGGKDNRKRKVVHSYVRIMTDIAIGSFRLRFKMILRGVHHAYTKRSCVKSLTAPDYSA